MTPLEHQHTLLLRHLLEQPDPAPLDTNTITRHLHLLQPYHEFYGHVYLGSGLDTRQQVVEHIARSLHDLLDPEIYLGVSVRALPVDIEMTIQDRTVTAQIVLHGYRHAVSKTVLEQTLREHILGLSLPDNCWFTVLMY